MLTSPPYNIGKVYEKAQVQSLEEYIQIMSAIAAKAAEKLAPGGSLCWQVGNFVRNGEVFPLDYIFYNEFAKMGLKLRSRIIWHFEFGLHAVKRLSGRYETLLWFSKGDNYKFNLDDIRVPQKYPGKRHARSKTNGKSGAPSGNPLGKNPSDFWTFSAPENFGASPVWKIPNVKANHPEHTLHPCQFPHELAERCVLAFSDEHDWILDPFSGAGTTVVAALKAGRRAIGIDKEQQYIDLTRERVEKLLKGEIKLRPSGLQVYQPSPREKNALLPGEWDRDLA